MIAAHPIKANLIRLTENIGFARANTLAARQAKGRYILLLNPDTVVLDGAIDKLVAFAVCTRKRASGAAARCSRMDVSILRRAGSA